MKQFFQFLINHWLLSSIFILILLLIIYDEIRGRVQGVPRLQPHELTRLINREGAVVLDVRDSHAFMKGHIIGAINIPHTAIDANLKKLSQYKTLPLVIVSANGQTGPQEGVHLKHQGFEKIYFLAGGLAAWQEAGLPLTRE